MLKQTIAASLAAIVVLSVSAQDWPNVIYHEQQARAEKAKPVNAARIAAEMKSAGLSNAKVTWYAVPAMSDVMRLTDTYPEDGVFQGELQATLAMGEFEPVSFELFSFGDLGDVTFKVGELAGPGGAKIGADGLDLRVVKLWFQNGNAWLSYFDDPGLKLVPELLLHDENIVKVDLKDAANYARVKDENGKDGWLWISSPKDFGSNRFDPDRDNFRDAKAMQPVQLVKNEFKQFILTVHAAKNQKPGVYRGKVDVLDKGGKALAAIPVAVRVLPFELPFPGTYADPTRPFAVCYMGAEVKPDKALLQSYFDHGLYHPSFYITTEESEQVKCIAMMQEIGFPLDLIVTGLDIGWFGLNFGGRMTFDQVMTAKNGAERMAKYWDRILGHHNILTSYGDEQGAAFVAAHREFFEFYFDKGIKVGCAGHDPLFFKGGYVYQNMPIGTSPDDKARIDRWNQVGDKYVAFYACQHTASENPQFVRYQHGLLGYLAGISMIDNYEFAIGPMNDRAHDVYRPMVMTYRDADGLMETIQWSGFREGIDDMRYATYLKLLVAEAFGKNPGRKAIPADLALPRSPEDKLEAKLLANKALQFMALLPHNMDLNATRAEMIEHILKLRKALGK